MSAAIDAPGVCPATTTDGLSLTGRGEGIAALAVVAVLPGSSVTP